jgi:hypothetical protein
MTLDDRDAVAGVQFAPAAVEVLHDGAELDDQHARQVGRSLLVALFQPESIKLSAKAGLPHPNMDPFAELVRR